MVLHRANKGLLSFFDRKELLKLSTKIGAVVN